MKRLITGFFFLLPLCGFAQFDTIQVHFLYGSRPAKGFKDSEKKVFGGIKGGHVSIQLGQHVLDFMPGNNPLFPDRDNPSGGFRLNQGRYWDTAGSKWKTIHVPVSPKQREQLEALFAVYSQETPYDYAIFGMRCAAASYDVLSEIGVFPEISNGWNIVSHFYPKLLRKKMLKWARDNNFPVISHEGKSSRKWEKDEGVL